MKRWMLVAAAGFLPFSAVAQSTAEYKPGDFETDLQMYLGSKADGISVSPMFASAVSDDVRKAVDAMAAATDYIAESLCPKRSRPTKITLHLTAGFKLVFEAETGSTVEWDLDTVCARFKK